MSVGNLPPGAEVLIKITYVSELVVEGEQIVFSLPGSVAPWKQQAALDETTQTDVEKVKVKEQRSAREHLMVITYIHWTVELPAYSSGVSTRALMLAPYLVY